MQDFELQLLARLVNGFPAGNISIILLINSAGNYQSKIDAFGKNLLKWDVETEAGEPKKKLTDWVATEPDPAPAQIEPTFSAEPPTLNEEVVPVSKLLNIPTKTAWRVPGFGKKEEPKLDPEPLPAFVAPPAPAPAPMPPTVAPLTAATPVAMPDTLREPTLQAPALAPSTSGDAELFKRPPRKSYAGWIVLVLLMSMAAFGVMYKDLVLEEAEALKKYLLRGTPAVPAPEEAASAAAAASAASADALAAAELAASVANEAARVASQAEQVASAASAAASAAVAPVVVAASTPASGASADAVEKPKADKERKAEKADVKADAKVEPKAEANSDEAWVDQLPANAYVVQLAAMDTQEEMRSFQRSNAAYSKARIMRARHKDNGKRYFILVAGPFETKAQADAFMQSSPLLAKGWLRTSKSMKTQFTKS
jgi:septal ring-binding cell division protein DamX